MNCRTLPLALLLAVAPAYAQTVSGSGSPNAVPVFTGDSTLGNSVIKQTNGLLGINTASPTANFELVGTSRVRGGVVSVANGAYVNLGEAYMLATSSADLRNLPSFWGSMTRRSPGP